MTLIDSLSIPNSRSFSYEVSERSLGAGNPTHQSGPAIAPAATSSNQYSTTLSKYTFLRVSSRSGTEYRRSHAENLVTTSASDVQLIPPMAENSIPSIEPPLWVPWSSPFLSESS